MVGKKFICYFYDITLSFTSRIGQGVLDKHDLQIG